MPSSLSELSRCREWAISAATYMASGEKEADLLNTRFALHHVRLQGPIRAPNFTHGQAASQAMSGNRVEQAQGMHGCMTSSEAKPESWLGDFFHVLALP
jgi:hypothetical protein